MGALSTKIFMVAVMAIVAGSGVSIYLSDQDNTQTASDGSQRTQGMGEFGQPSAFRVLQQEGQGGLPDSSAQSARPSRSSGAPDRPQVSSGPPGGSRFSRSTPVIVTAVVLDEFVDTIEAIGTARSNESVVVTAKVTETVSLVSFYDGQSVEAGQILVELADVEARADLEEARVSMREAQKGFNRVSGLVSRGNATGSSLDTAVAALDRAKAHVNALEARLADRLIRAPFAGVLGLRVVSPGMLVRPGDTIVTLDDISTIKLDFSIPETFLGAFGLGLEVTASSAAYPKQRFSGIITAIDTRVDPDTRAIKMRAEIPNQELLLKPGMLLTTIIINDRRKSMMVPEEAIVPVKDQLFVYVVQDSGRGTTVEQRYIEIGSRRPGAVEVLRGLEVGERIVTEGTHRVSPGGSVNIVSTESTKDGA